MEKAVQVGLVFPRSGQQVQVNLPTAHAERLGLRNTEDQARTTTVLHQNRANQAHEATKHA
jgi:hypothetical protein